MCVGFATKTWFAFSRRPTRGRRQRRERCGQVLPRRRPVHVYHEATASTFVGPSILAPISFEGGGSVGGVGRSDGQHVEGEGLSAEGVEACRGMQSESCSQSHRAIPKRLEEPVHARSQSHRAILKRLEEPLHARSKSHRAILKRLEEPVHACGPDQGHELY